MAKRWFSSDFHLGFSALLKIEKWPFPSIEKHDAALLRSCAERAKQTDTIIHVGDLASYGQDNHNGINSKGLNINPMVMISSINAMFINIRGNHDQSNKVKSVCDSMRTTLGKRFLSVSISHFPTYDKRCAGHFRNGDIHICGHVHDKWKHCIDLDHKCLNINVGCMVWGWKIISEEELIQYISELLTHKPDDLYRCKVSAGGRAEFFGEPSF